ncbi:MAG: NAD(P)-dependent oxidoreductase [Firmicutes bacterium]|jgi:predicted homoserine dehydrogenase-like protein|nr:NAD(P)-dependent oxidoreductase [Bacillota bacterium]
MTGYRLREELAAREKAKNPVKIGVAGAGFLGRGLVNQISRMQGLRVVALAARRPEQAGAVLNQAGKDVKYRRCHDLESLQKAIACGEVGVVTDPLLLAGADLDIVVDCTGDPEAGAALGCAAIKAGRNFIANPETDATAGAALKALADKAGVVYSGADGDEPGVIMNLYNYVSLLGLEIVAAGKFKGYLNHFATPATVKKWARLFAQNPYKIASFADGTKMNMEMAIVANATGLSPDTRGMNCPRGTLEEVARLMQKREDGGVLSNTGVVEVVLGAEPSGAVFVVATVTHPQIKKDLQYLKMGDGPNYLFYRPYHLCGMELGIAIARAVLAGEATIAPAGSPVAEVLAVAKRDLRPGEVLDQIGGYTFYGLIDRAAVVRRENLLPAGLAPGARVLRPVKAGHPLTMDDVELKPDSVLRQLYLQTQPA